MNPPRRTFSRDIIDDWLTEEKTSLSVAEAKMMLACSTNIVNELVKSGILVPSREQRHASRRFSYSGIKALLRSIEERAQPVDPARDLVSMRTMARQTEMTTIQILRRIIEGRVAYVSFVGRKLNLESIRIDRGEFAPRALVKNNYLSTREVAKRFRLTPPTLTKLVSMNFLSTTERIHAIHKAPYPFFSADEIERFLNEYVPLSELARRLKRHSPSLRKQIESQGVAQLFEKDDHRLATFYPRSEVESLGFM